MNSKRRLLIAILHLARLLGLFALARRITAKELRILGFHGTAIGQEEAFEPSMFMDPKLFRARMALLRKRRYPVLGLDAAIAAFAAGTLPPNAVVITVDDGWTGTHQHMLPVWRDYQLPATVYVCTYYVEKQTQVFNMVVRYYAWLAGNRTIQLNTIDERLGDQAIAAHLAATLVIELGLQEDRADQRQALADRFATAAGLDPKAARQYFRYMNPAQLKELVAAGVDLQLHTHRHYNSFEDQSQLQAEVADNRAALAQVTDAELNHYCYPSGRHVSDHAKWLRELGIRSATTTEPGFNPPGTDVYFLRRIIETGLWSDIEFEARLSGFSVLARRWLGRDSDTRSPQPT